MMRISQPKICGIIVLLSVVSFGCTGDLVLNDTTFRRTNKLLYQSTQTTFNTELLDRTPTESSLVPSINTKKIKTKSTSSNNEGDAIALGLDCTNTYKDSCNTFNETSLTKEPDGGAQWLSTPGSITLTNRTNEINSTLNTTQNFSDNFDRSLGLKIVSSATICVGFFVVKINIIVMIAFVRNRELRQNNHYNLVMGLSFSDLLMGLSSLGTGFRVLFPTMVVPLSLCIVKNLSISSLILSFFQIFCISLNRYLVISVNPCANYLFDGHRKYYVCIVGWASILICFSFLTSPGQTICLSASDLEKSFFVTRWVACSLFLFFLLLIVIFYFLAIFEIRRRYTNVSGIVSSQIDAKKKKTLVKSMKLVGIILLALFIFSDPLAFSVIYGNIPSMHVGAFAAANLNSFVNPFIYCSRIKSLRSEIKSFLCCSSEK